MDRALLYKRIEERIDQMVGEGLVQEVRALLAEGYTRDMVSMQGLGYKEIAGYLEGAYPLAEAIEMLKKSTRHFAKRQLSWFRHMADIEWIDVSEMANISTQLEKIRAIIAGKLTLVRN